jgi:GxxExxY protein
MAVHRALGCGFLEAVSREALTIELQEREIPFVREARLQVRYRNRILPVAYCLNPFNPVIRG